MAEGNSTDALLGFLLGAAAGAAAGILLAPRSGAETREQLGDWLQEAGDKTRAFVHKEKEILRQKKEQVGSAIEAAQKAYREAA